MYSDRVRQLVGELPLSGEVEHPTHSARLDNPMCGDRLHVTLRLQEGRIEEFRYRVEGCAAALAAAAALALMCQGQSIDECRCFTPQDVIDSLGGLPSHKTHGAQLAIECLQQAIG